MPCPALALLLLAFAQDPTPAEIRDLLKDYLEVPNPIINERAATRIRALGARLVPLLEQELRAAEVDRRRRAAAGAALIGTAATPLMELLALQLGEDDPRLAGNAAAALGQIGAAARPAVGALAELATSKDPELRRLSLVSRARIVARPQVMIAELTTATRDPAIEPRRAAALLLIRYASDGPELYRSLLPLTRDRDPVLAKEAIAGLVARGEPARDWCFELAREGEPLDKARALMLLGSFRPLEDRHITLLLDELEAREFNQAARTGLMATGTLAKDRIRERCQAAMARGAADEVLDRFLFCYTGLGEVAAPFDVDLLPLLSRTGPLRIHALRTLIGIGVTDARIQQALLALARTGKGEVAQLAVDALGHVQGAEPGLIDALLGLLREEPNLRRATGYALGRLGDATLARGDALLDLALADDVAGQWARVALGMLGGSVLPRIDQRLAAGGDPATRRRLVQTVAEMTGTKAPLPLLLRTLDDEDPDLRVAAALAIGRMGELGRDAQPALLEATGDGVPEVRLAAVTALGMFGRGDRRLVEPLSAKLQDGDAAVVRAAVDALGRLGLPETVEALTGLLGHEDAQVRWRAAQALGELGTGAASALPALLEATGDGDPIVAQSAAKAAQQVRKPGR